MTALWLLAALSDSSTLVEAASRKTLFEATNFTSHFDKVCGQTKLNIYIFYAR